MITFTRTGELNAPLDTVEANFEDWWKARPEARQAAKNGLDEVPAKAESGQYVQTRHEGGMVITTKILLHEAGTKTGVEYVRTIEGMSESKAMERFMARWTKGLFRSWNRSFNAYLKQVGPTPPQL